MFLRSVSRLRGLIDEAVSRHGDLNPYADARKVLEIAVNKAIGQVASGLQELREPVRAITKGRKYGTQLTGDVWVGDSTEPYAKSVEAKSKTDIKVTNVDKELKKALQQINGFTGKKPRTGDARVVDLLISEARNCWPFPGDDQERTLRRLDKFLGQVNERLLQQIANSGVIAAVTEYLNSDGGWVDDGHDSHEVWPLGSVCDALVDGCLVPDKNLDTSSLTEQAWVPLHSSRPINLFFDKKNSADSKDWVLTRYWVKPVLTIKIRYATGYPVYISKSTEPKSLMEVKLQATGPIEEGQKLKLDLHGYDLDDGT
jgi:hypothetical protein